MIEALRHIVWAVLALALLPATLEAASRRGEDPDWPCIQRRVPTLSAGTFWSGPSVAGAGDWRGDHEVAALVERIVPRRVTPDAGEAAIAQFADGLGFTDDRAQRLTLVFVGLVEETNRERGALLARIEDLGHRQNGLAEIASRAGEEMRRIPEDATGEDAARRADLEQRFVFVTRAFESTQRTLRYACEAPVELEARLGRYARALESRL